MTVNIRQLMGLVAEALACFLIGAGLGQQLASNPTTPPVTLVALPADVCELVPESIRQELMAAHSAGLDRLVEYDLRLLVAQATDCN